VLFSHTLFVCLYCILISFYGHIPHWDNILPDYFLPLFCYSIRYFKHPTAPVLTCITGLGCDLLLHQTFPFYTCFFFAVHIVFTKLPMNVDKDNFLSYIVLLCILFFPSIAFSHFIGFAKWYERDAISCFCLTLIICPILYLVFSLYGRIFSHSKLVRKYSNIHA
jgi:hypothetical protein